MRGSDEVQLDGKVWWADSPVLGTSIEGIRVVSLDHQGVEPEDLAPLERALERAAGEAGPVVLDLDGCERLTSSLLVVLARWAKHHRLCGRPFGVCATSPTTRRLLGDLRLGAHLDLFQDLSAAIQAFRPGARRPLGDILLSEFGLGYDDLHRALRRQSREGGLLGHILLTERAITPRELTRALSRQAAVHA